MKAIKVNTRFIGPTQPCFIAAEVGINHNGDLDLAHKLIDAAAEAGVDAVKFQNYRTEDFVSDRSLTYEYISQGQTVVESQYDMFKRCELSPTELMKLREHCDERGLVFFSTPTSKQGITDLVNSGVSLLKNGSDYLQNTDLIQAMAQTGLPTVISTGMATLAEIDEAVRTFQDGGGQDLVLLHCTSSYPTPAEDVHLRKIPALAAAFACPVGLSDHTSGIVAAIGAVVLGACFIEKHFTLDKQLPGPDHRFSADPEEFRQLVEAVRTIEKNLGNSKIGPASSELHSRREYRLSCVVRHTLPAGHVLTENDLAFRRPGRGIPPAHAYLLIGRMLRQNVEQGQVLTLENFV